MADETPEIKVVIGTGGDAINLVNETGPINSDLIILKPEVSTGITVIPSTGDLNTPTNLATTGNIRVILGTDDNTITTEEISGPLNVSEPFIIKPATTDGVIATPVIGDVNPPEYLASLRFGSTAIEKFRAVTVLPDGKIAHLDPSNELQRRAFLGISITKAGAGRPSTIVTEGLVSSNDWNWLIGPVYSDHDGILTQDVPSVTMRVATALTPTQLKIGAINDVPQETTATTLIYDFSPASTQWVIVHNMGRYPVVSVVDSGQNMIFADVKYVDINTLEVNFAYPTSGSAYLV